MPCSLDCPGGLHVEQKGADDCDVFFFVLFSFVSGVKHAVHCFLGGGPLSAGASDSCVDGGDGVVRVCVVGFEAVLVVSGWWEG